MKIHRLWTLVLPVFFAGCAMQDPPLVQGPMSARPQPQPQLQANNGSIFQTSSYRPLVEDSRPGLVGDTLTVTIQEQSTTSATEQVTESRASSLNETLGAGVNIPFVPNSLSTSAAATQNGKGSNQLATSFVSSISVTVIDVLANGNLVVSGEKQVRINGDVESIRLSGVVNPRDIDSTRSVSSLKVADARIEQETKGTNRLYNDPGWLTKIFLSILPF
ncbi:MAG: flagellar basal body L-ring protein FlgH [Paludibacterium sp.]|uniref:flagellar basal body L-ring protein FlgH n=1 Tax=Paludibacterium sp. TaxID=1917523 RepID=UPI0025FFF360|nr:flagellar basal body L-ring protein FlgH [Paludibacterium sp.]MBV8046988.1 flagellar basal body L-ring protein FlgH [Paludibacterium sp.]MBV8647238.1 flagellar basal body L-ring protein FlgH [Paludibacterium sp.]